MIRSLAAILTSLTCFAMGCSDPEHERSNPNSEPTTSSPSRDRSAADPAGTERPPRLTAVAARNTLAGAEAFVHHYVELLNYASATGQVARLTDSARDCDGCAKYVELYKETYASGGYMKGGEWTPTAIDIARQEDRVAIAFLSVHASRMRYKLGEDSKEKIGRSDDFDFRLELSRYAGEWVVTDLGLQATLQDL